MIRPGRAATRNSTARSPTYQVKSIPAPTIGLIANNNLATPIPGGAAVLKNFIPTPTGARLRRGSQRHAIIGLSGAPVTSMFAYANGNNRKMFAANATAIYDVTTPALSEDQFLVDEDGAFIVNDDGDFIIFAGTPDASVTGLTGGNWSVVQFATSDGVYLSMVNGIDTPRNYDGTNFATTPAITGVDPTTLSYVWVHQQRLFFVEKDSLSAWYLPSASIGGAAVEIPLAGVFTLGGSLLFGSNWSLETGAAGLSEQCIFVTTEGEVAVFQGTDPSSASTWAKVGQYKIGKPLGPKAHFRAGGDIVIATDIGLVPLSTALKKDFAILSQTAVSANIDTIWNEEVRTRSTDPWNCVVWSRNQIALVVPPKLSGQTPVMYPINTRNGACAQITGWDATCLLVFEDRLFFGTATGRVIEANVTGLDENTPYTGVYVPLFSDLDIPGVKTTGRTRAVLLSQSAVNDKITMLRDYDTSLPTPPDAATVSVANAWDTAIWGEGIWGAGTAKTTYANWRATPKNGNAVAPALQITSGALPPLDVEIVKLDVEFTTAETVV